LSEHTSPEGRYRRYLLVLGFVYLSILGWSRLRQALLAWDLLREVGVSPGPWYLVAGGFVWGVLGLAAAVFVLMRRPWSGRAAFAAALALALSYWLDFLIFTSAAEMMVNWPFSLGVTAGGLLYAAWVTRPLRAG
jgi:hypothetical protein